MTNITVTPAVVAATIDGLSAKFLAVHEAMDALSEALESAAQTLKYAALTPDDLAAVQHIPVLAADMLKGIEIKRNAKLVVTLAGLSA